MTKQSIHSFFRADHERLRGLFAEFQERKMTDFPAARRAFQGFAVGLRRHIVWEEEILFPLFEAKTGMKNGGPTHVMRLEHVDIRGYLSALEERVARGETDGGGTDSQLMQLLSEHDGKEEGILYPSIDMLIGADELAEAFRRIEAVAEPASGCSCCSG
ncbi:MAG: hemerythrin domain-containing protein [Deltaproteobacteria bacterium]|nr:hemerythrin domain-containing protein [Deltaproteobacteria bacterium]